MLRTIPLVFGILVAFIPRGVNSKVEDGGGKIAFHSNRDGNLEIYLMDFDGANVISLTNNPAEDSYASWSPDGTKVVFESDREGNFEIYTMDADGSNLNRLTHNLSNDLSSSWLPDGSRIAFDSDMEGGSHIFVMDARANTVQVTKGGGINLFANWSRDGSKLFFVSLEKEDRGDFFTVDLKSMKRTRITHTPYLNTAPSLLGF